MHTLAVSEFALGLRQLTCKGGYRISSKGLDLLELIDYTLSIVKYIYLNKKRTEKQKIKIINPVRCRREK